MTARLLVILLLAGCAAETPVELARQRCGYLEQGSAAFARCVELEEHAIKRRLDTATQAVMEQVRRRR